MTRIVELHHDVVFGYFIHNQSFLKKLTVIKNFQIFYKRKKSFGGVLLLWSVLQNSLEKICNGVLILVKLQAYVFSFIKTRSLLQVFSCAFCEFSHKRFSKYWYELLFLKKAAATLSKNCEICRSKALENYLKRKLFY